MRTLSLPNESSLRRKNKHILSLFSACHKFHTFTIWFFQQWLFISITEPDGGTLEYLEEDGCPGPLHHLGRAEVETNCEHLPETDRRQSANHNVYLTKQHTCRSQCSGTTGRSPLASIKHLFQSRNPVKMYLLGAVL